MQDNVRFLLEDRDAAVIFEALQAGGREIRFIGGCVRDALLDRAVGDIDLATTATPEQMQASMPHVKLIPTGMAHGTMTAVVNRRHFEITTLRRDVQTNGRHAVVAYSDDWAEDARRRDFTINALSLDASGHVFDYCDGLADMAAQRLRFIGNAAQRIQEDYLRILRYFRFAATLAWAVDEADLQACSIAAEKLPSLSRERIQAELYKLLSAPAAGTVAMTLAERGIFTAFQDARIDAAALERLIEREQDLHINDPFRRILAMFGIDDRVLEKIIVLTGLQKRRLQDLKKISDQASWPLSKQLYYFGQQVVLDFYLLNNQSLDLATVETWRKPVFPLSSDDLMELAKGPGPRLGEFLRETERYWIDNDFKPTAEDLKAYAATL